ncbi:MAG: hypothetical protein SOI44_01055 [Lactimicrobium sp.]|jgi:PTS system maltose and glucose-specific IIC component|uniref:hypothetical protein n=1 Tax=Lactimicrobium sp. TaxID=2563780 RepID=UPI002F36114A
MQKIWHSFYELLKTPLEIMLVGYVFLGIGNLLVNPAFSTLYSVHTGWPTTAAMILARTGSFLIVNFPLLFLIRIVSRRSSSYTTILAAIGGYAAFLSATMVLHSNSLPASAYSSILGISMSQSVKYSSQTVTIYPLQTGVIAMVIVAAATIFCFRHTKNVPEQGSHFSFSSVVFFKTVLLSAAGGILIALIWPYLVTVINKGISFLASDTSSSVMLGFYGVLDRIFGVLNLGTLFRTPFWYSTQGGSWVSAAGTNITGDASVWTAQYAAGSLNGMAGRYFTPYYILNLFAIPGLLWGTLSLTTDRAKRRRQSLLVFLLTIVSLFSGILLPVEIAMLLVAPLLFVIHLGLTGILFALLQGLHIYLGYYTTSSLTMTALPGTLMELLVYLQTDSLRSSILKLVIIGVICFIIWFVISRLYFRYLALDLFHSGKGKQTILETERAVGGLSNISRVESSYDTLYISIYDHSIIDTERLIRLGGVRVLETPDGVAVTCGPISTMVAKGIRDGIRSGVRDTI